MEKEHRLVTRLREINKGTPKPTYEAFQKAIEHESPEICANTMITLIKICTYILSKQIKHQEMAFIKEGGLRERMTKARLDERRSTNKNAKDNSDHGHNVP